MPKPKFELLFQLSIVISAAVELGQTPAGLLRRFDYFSDGEFKGPQLSGTLVQGVDVRLTRFDGVFKPDVRALLCTNDGHYIQMTYEGIRSGSDEVWKRVESGEIVDPSEYYFRITARFETGSKKYEWVNRLMAFGSGIRTKHGPIYDIYHVL